MSNQVQWAESTKIQKTGKRDFLNISEEPIKVRIAYEPIAFYKVFANRTACCVTEQTAKTLYKEFPAELKYQPKISFAIRVINRKDGLSYIMEFKRTIMNVFIERYKIDPDGMNSDWAIYKEGTGLNTKYHALFLEKSILTNEEKQHIEVLETVIDENYKELSYTEAIEKLQL